MSSIPTLPGITSQVIPTSRLRVHVLSAGPAQGTPVLFIHGNGASSTFWEETMLALPGRLPGDRARPAWLWRHRAAAGGRHPRPGRHGRRRAGHDRCVWASTSYHLVGHSMGGGVAMKW